MGTWNEMCKNPPGIKLVSDTTSVAVPEETVIVQALIDGKEFEAMLDTGAGVSVTDFTSLKRLVLLGKLIKEQQGTLKAFENSETKIIGQVLLETCIGGYKVEQCFSVIEGAKGGMTMVLGRAYLRKFGSTEFDWKNGRVRSGQHWLQPKLWLRGGNHNERVALISEMKEITEQDFDINPDLEPTKKQPFCLY